MLRKIQLSNGLKVVHFPLHKAPVVTLQAWVNTGSADERPGEEGISHFIEHLLFKGTQRFKVGEIAKMVEGAGGELNAYTSFDQTVFHITLSKNYTEMAMGALSQMMGFPSFDSGEIDNEREVVIEEIKRSNDNPHRVASQLLFETVYKDHPYRVPVIGFEENIRKFSPKQIQSYFSERYSPKNMFLVIVGDWEYSKAMRSVREYFGPIKKTGVRAGRREGEGLQKSPRISVKQSQFQESFLHLAFPGPSVDSEDLPALEILTLILGQGDSSRLVKRLRLDGPLVNSISAHVYSPRDPGFVAVGAGFQEKNLKEVLTNIGEELLLILAEPPREEELEKALIQFESDEVFGIETVDGLARKFGTFEQLFENAKYFEKYLSKIQKTKRGDLLRVARKYFDPNGLSACLLSPGETGTLEKDLKKWAGDFRLGYGFVSKMKAPMDLKRGSRKKGKTKIKFSSQSGEVKRAGGPGDSLLLLKSSAAPILSVKIAFLGGQREESFERQGMTELMSNSWLGGTQGKSEEEILREMESHGFSIRPFSGRNTVGLSVSALKEQRGRAFDLFFDLLTRATFPEEVFQREKEIMTEALKHKWDNPAGVAIQNFQELMFEGHPYSGDMQGTEKSLTQLSNDAIRNHWAKMVSRENSSLVVVGDFHDGALQSDFLKRMSELPRGERLTGKKILAPLQSNKNRYEKIEREQTHIVYGVRGISLADPRRYVLQVLQSVLAGQGGRLFLELRDKASLAYSVSPIHLEGIEGGYFGAYIGCSPEKSSKAIKMMNDEFRRVSEEDVGDQELERAKKYLIGSHDIGLQRFSSQASALLFEEVYGLPYQAVFNYEEKLAEVSAKDVREIAQQLFSQNTVISVVGPKNVEGVY